MDSTKDERLNCAVFWEAELIVQLKVAFIWELLSWNDPEKGNCIMTSVEYLLIF